MPFNPTPAPTTGSSGGSSSSSSSGTQTGGGSPSAGSAISASAAATKARQIADSEATFEAYLGHLTAGAGLIVNKNLRNLVHNASHNLWSMDRFIAALAHTAEFHKAFPGIFNRNGTLRMDPTAYITQKSDIAQAASAAGVNVNNKTLDKMMVNRVNPNLAAQRFQVEALYTANAESFNGFNQELKAMGHRPMSKKAITLFIAGEAPAGFYQLYHNWQSRIAASNAGFSLATALKNKKGRIVGYTSGISEKGRLTDNQDFLTRAEQTRIGAQGFTTDQLSSGMQKLANDFRSAFPESQRQGMGITHDDLVQLEFGGTRQAAVQKKVSQIMGNVQMKANENYAGTQTNLGSRGSKL